MKNLNLKDYTKQKDYLVCVDSDGTVIDAMAAKHNHCHGPALIAAFNLEEYENEIQALWNNINLYSSTRGVNRFIAILKFLDKAEGVYLPKQDRKELEKWVSKNDLSNDSLEMEILSNPDPLLQKALEWSIDINERILRLSNKDKPIYDGVREFFESIKGKADLAVVSSSNMSALTEEWGGHNLINYLDVLTSQEIGTKGDCLAELIKKGYDPKKILMIGDSNPDIDAANENGTNFYAILTRFEDKSWKDLREKYFDLLITDNYSSVQAEVIKNFEDNLLDNQ